MDRAPRQRGEAELGVAGLPQGVELDRRVPDLGLQAEQAVTERRGGRGEARDQQPRPARETLGKVRQLRTWF